MTPYLPSLLGGQQVPANIAFIAGLLAGIGTRMGIRMHVRPWNHRPRPLLETLFPGGHVPGRRDHDGNFSGDRTMILIALLAGAAFGVGLSASRMLDPARVLGFLDLASGHWDPSLMFVLGGALLVAVPGVMLQRRMARPVLDLQFHLPQKMAIDRPLLAGSAIFGIGWGIAGFCPGPAVSALSLGLQPVLLFVATMAAGMVVHDRIIAKGPWSH